jgi:tRNA(fMet)-specific endonuclease VapC
MIADTTFLIDLLTDEAAAATKAIELEEKGNAIIVGAPSIFELYVGAMRSGKPDQEKSKIVSIIASLPQAALEFESAKVGGEIYVAKVRAGSMMDPEDAMLAGISKVRGEPIITRNEKHFRNIEGVAVESY